MTPFTLAGYPKRAPRRGLAWRSRYRRRSHAERVLDPEEEIMSNVLVAEIRSDFGKGAARKSRREGKVPAVIYGHGSAPIHVALDAHELTQALRHKATSLEVSVDGKTQTVAPRDIQIEPVRRFIEHVDLVVVTAAEAAAIARDAAEASARAEAEANAAANAAAEKAAARAARQAEGSADAPAAEATEAAAEDAPAEGDAE